MLYPCNGAAFAQSHQALRFLRQIRGFFCHTQLLCASQASAPDIYNCRESKPFIASYADNVFDKIPKPGLSDYNHWIFEYSRNNRNLEARSLFLDMFRSGVPLDGSTTSCVFKVCGALRDHLVGKQLHCHSVKCGFLLDVSVGTSLIDMYMKTGNLYWGEEFFGEMVMKNVVSWTSLLAGYANNGVLEKALEVFCQMQEEEVQPNPFTYATVFGALADLGTSEKGIQVHTQVIKVGLESSTYVGNSLINMYLKFGLVGDAKNVFMNVESKDVVSWNGMIAGLVTNGLDLEALKLFYEMKHAGVQPTQSIFAPVIKACTYIKELCYVKQLQCQVTKRGFETDLNIRTALMVAYSKSSRMDDAIEMFNTMKGSQNVVSWTAMISGYLQSNRKAEAVNLFLEMSRAGVIPNDFTFSMILTAHPLISPFQVHAQVIKTNHKDSTSAGTALLDAYVKTGNNQEATKVFEKVAVRDIVMWSAMLSGYAQAGNIERAVDLFSRMIKEGIKPNEFTFSGILNVCASPTASAEQGKQFHAASIKYGQSNALAVSSALVTMYSKRGNIESANDVFRRQGERDLVSWNSMISGFAQHGYGKRALEIFEEMRKKKMDMDGITFIGVITACTHAGLADDGQKFFNLMVKDLQIKPTVEHYACMVDLYGRAGKLDKAMNLINKMPFPADATIWRTLLGACRVQKNVELGKMAAEKLMVLQPQHSAAYVLLSNIYAAAGNWNERAKVRSLMDKRKVKKEAGYSWIVLKNKTHAFLAGDRSHPLSNLIYSKLQDLTTRLKDMGYRPDTDFVLHDIEDELKEGMLFQHSERLAVVLGLISTPNGTPLQIEKNLRVCGDCHTVFKLISKIEGREITVRDTIRFHHFKGGLCSCGDFW